MKRRELTKGKDTSRHRALHKVVVSLRVKIKRAILKIIRPQVDRAMLTRRQAIKREGNEICGIANRAWQAALQTISRSGKVLKVWKEEEGRRRNEIEEEGEGGRRRKKEEEIEGRRRQK